MIVTLPGRMYTSLNDVITTDVHDFTNTSSSCIQCCQTVCSLFSVWAYTRFVEYIMLNIIMIIIMYMQICLKHVMYACVHGSTN